MLNPYSRVYAIRNGSPELQGWDPAMFVAVRTHNLIAGLIQGLSGKSDKSMFLTVPGTEEREETVLRPATLADITVSGFTEFMYG